MFPQTYKQERHKQIAEGRIAYFNLEKPENLS